MADLLEAYKERFETFLVPIALRIETDLKELFKETKHIDRVGARAKDVDRFIEKAAKIDEKTGKPKYTDAINQIQDQVGARIITFYLQDVENIKKIILENFNRIEEEYRVPDAVDKFGYIGQHFILYLPQSLQPEADSSKFPKFFELQIKTLFQHAWSESNHDLTYKPPKPLSTDQQRRAAFTAAQAWGADMVLEGLQKELLAHKDDDISNSK